MMDNTNYRRYRSGQSHHYYDNLAKVSLFDMRPPYYGRWHVTVDLGRYGGGGFGLTIADSFGEDLFKEFIAESILEAEALKNKLRALATERRVAVLHYAPIRETVEGEPPEIHAFLGTSRLGTALDKGGATAALHGHAHAGSFEGKTPGGVPVFNVS